MLLNLISLQLRAFFSGLMKAVRTKKKSVKLLFLLLLIYAFGTCALSVGMLFSGLCEPLCDAGLTWLYFAVAALFGMGFCLIGSIFTCKSQIYSAKDNELLLAMPIRPNEILTARIFSITLTNWLYCLIVTLPSIIVYIIFKGFDLGTFVRFLVSFLFLPLIPEALGSLFGWLLSLLERHITHKSLFTTAFTVVFLVLYFMLIGRIDSFIEYLGSNGDKIAASVAVIIPAGFFGKGIAGSLPHLAGFIALSAAAMAIAVALLSRGFLSVATAPAAVKRNTGKAAGFESRSLFFSLIDRELRHFAASPMYMMNAGIGLLLMPIVSVALVFKSSALTEVLASLPVDAFPIGTIAALFLALVSTTVLISAPSVSIEGKTLWLIRSLPVASSDILLAKARTHYLLCLPFCLVSAIVCLFLPGVTIRELPLLILLPAAECLFCAFLGVTINLQLPRFDWINETQAVKQGMSTIVCMLLAFTSVVIPVVLYIWLLRDSLSVNAMAYILTLLLLAGALLMKRYLSGGGARKFDTLQ